MAEVTFSVRIEGLAEIQRKLDPSVLLKPLEDFFKKAAITVQSKARERSPLDTGRLRSSIQYTASATRAEIGTNVTARGFPYPAALDASPRYHYRGKGPFGGAPTQGWFTKHALKDSESQIMGYLDDVSGEIEAIWGS